MSEVRSRKNGQEPKKKRKKKYNGQQQKDIDCDEPHPAPNEKTQPIQWTERPIGALVAVVSLWPQNQGHNEVTPTIAPPVGRFVHKMGCVFFHPVPDPGVNPTLYHSQLFGLLTFDTLFFSYFGVFFPTLTLIILLPQLPY